MFIKKVELKNFKCFDKAAVDFCIPDGATLGSGLNIFVGENNSGKSSFFEAIYFLRNKGSAEVKKIGAAEGAEFWVEEIFTGDIENCIEGFIQDNKKAVFKDKIYKDQGELVFKVRRTFESDESRKKILFYKESEGAFKNETGIDAPFQSFFQISNIWADTNPESETKFGASTICGNLLSDISEKFKIDHRGQYEKFLEIFNETFNDDKAGLQRDLNGVAKETEDILNEQFGTATLKFKFDNPEPDILFKNIKILVDDGDETDISEKGHGMQRAIMLSLLQVYAKRITEIKDEEGKSKIRPHFLFIDEPEMGLHPQAQRKLFEALKVISKTHQVFIATHSENFISSELISNIFKFQKEPTGIEIYSGKNLRIDLKANRKFFLHHHKLFFARKGVFVEGADDFDRYQFFCEKNSLDALKKDFYLMGGSGDYSIFKELCLGFGIKSIFIFDLDVISISNPTLKKSSSWTEIQKLNVSVTHKDPSNLFDSNLDAIRIALKKKIIGDLKSDNIFVLSEGAIEQYLQEDGNVIGGGVLKKAELEGIFGEIAK